MNLGWKLGAAARTARRKVLRWCAHRGGGAAAAGAKLAGP